MKYDQFSFALHELCFSNEQIVPLTKRIIQFLAEQGAYCQHFCIRPLDKRELKKSYSRIIAHLNKYEHHEQAMESSISCFAHTDYRANHYDYNAKCGFNNGSCDPRFQSIFSTQPTLTLDIICETYDRINSDSLNNFLHELVLELHPRYGYWTLCNFNMFSYGYARALTHDSEENKRNGEWQNAPDYQAWNQGYIRNVYPGNYLNEEQLSRYVTELTLGEWIAADSTRGTLTQMTPDLWYWQIAPELIPPVRAMLDAAQITFKREYILPKRGWP